MRASRVFDSFKFGKMHPTVEIESKGVMKSTWHISDKKIQDRTGSFEIRARLKERSGSINCTSGIALDVNSRNLVG